MIFAAAPVVRLGPVDIAAMRDWIAAIPFEAWPQQSRLADGKLRPAMVNGRHWAMFEGARFEIEEVVRDALSYLGPPVRFDTSNDMLSVVMPGHSIPSHTDRQLPHWVCRIHVPLMANPGAIMTVAGVEHNLDAGTAYALDTRVPHAIRNDGDTPRVHFMFDVLEAL